MKGGRLGLALLLSGMAVTLALAAAPRDFASLDADHDGYLSQSELQQACSGGVMGAMMGGRQGMPAMDANGDGKISQEEFTAHYTLRHGQRFTALDTNHDGMLDSKELANRPHHLLNGSTEAWIKQYDKDGDGKLSATEFDAAQPER